MSKKSEGKTILSFQRYRSRENIHSYNAMLLLKKLYEYSPEKFYNILATITGLDGNSFMPQFTSQTKDSNQKSVPDGKLFQTGFQIYIEAKDVNSSFDEKQLANHLDYFDEGGEYQFLIALAPSFDKKSYDLIKDLNETCGNKIKTLTYKDLCENVMSVVNEYKDTEFYNMINEYYDYCSEEGLIDESEDIIKMRAANATWDANCEFNVYYDTASHTYAGFRYIGLYKDKAMRKIGKIKKIISAVEKNGELTFECVQTYDKLPYKVEQNEKDAIRAMIERSSYSELKTNTHNYFFVEKFVDTFYEKKTKGSLFGQRNISIKNDLGFANSKQDIYTIAAKLKTLTW